ncbi:zinc finger protein HD1-like [Brassica napus]|uniref:zinc finger protein HD1-like n=1 Tax=Brassica napus TaxID=3708 RepID=UPI00207877D0|nr:zinc finger protein HD1-like [Brassica napus]
MTDIKCKSFNPIIWTFLRDIVTIFCKKVDFVYKFHIMFIKCKSFNPIIWTFLRYILIVNYNRIGIFINSMMNFLFRFDVSLCMGHFTQDSSCSGFDSYKTKEIENICLSNFDDYKALFDLKECFTADELILTDQLIDRIITKHNADTKAEKVIPSLSSVMSSVTHKDYNTEALANASCEDYKKNQMICAKAKDEINNNVEIFPNALTQLDRGPSQLILTDIHDMSLWDDQTPASRAYDPQARLEALKRYFAKKEKHKFGKQIRYESRKSTADTKRRLKGRFTKVGADYDYDPRVNNNMLRYFSLNQLTGLYLT